jgi:hypothetical protein
MNNNVRNIGTTINPTYYLEVEYEGFLISIQGTDLTAVRDELRAEINRVEAIVLATTEEAA